MLNKPKKKVQIPVATEVSAEALDSVQIQVGSATPSGPIAIPEAVGTVVPAMLGLHSKEPTTNVTVVSAPESEPKIAPVGKLETLLSLVREFKDVATSQYDSLEEMQKKAAELLQRREPFSILAWSELTDTALAKAILDSGSDFSDPRPNIKTDCMFLGKSKDTPSEAVLSFCYPKDDNSCFYRFCVSVPEMIEYIDQHKDQTGIQNPFRDEIIKRVPELTEYVSETLAPDFVETVKFHHEVLETRSQILQIKNPQERGLMTIVATLVAECIQKTPGIAQIGGLMQWGWNKVPSFVKNGVAKLGSAVKWVFNNPFLSNLVIILSKALRLFLCALLSGVSATEFKMLLESILESFKSNPLVNILINVSSSLLSCTLSIGIKGLLNPMAYGECLMKVVVGSLDTVYTFAIKHIKHIIVYVVRRLLEIVLPRAVTEWIMDKVEYANECVDSPFQCAAGLFMGSRSTQLSLNPVVRDELFANISSTVFFGILCLVPASLIDTLLDIVVPFLPSGGHVIKLKDFLLTTVGKLTGKKDLSIGDILLLGMKTVAVQSTVLQLCKELYSWFVDVGGCWLKKIRAHLSPETYKADKACCFKGLVEKIREIFATTIDTKSIVKKWWYSDRRLKKILPTQKPVFHVRSGTKHINFYLYKWDMKAIKKLSPGQQKKFNDSQVFVGVMAQDIKKDFPHAVKVDSSGLMKINQEKLGCDLVLILSALNGTLPPKKCQRKLLTLHKL